jgi:hypothetical protein
MHEKRTQKPLTSSSVSELLDEILSLVLENHVIIFYCHAVVHENPQTQYWYYELEL